MTEDADRAEPSLEVVRYSWEQYEYRHGVCWRAVYKVTAAVVALGIVPYLHTDLVGALGYWAVVPPSLALALAILGYRFVRNELELFARAKVAHFYLEDRFWRRTIGRSRVRKYVERQLDPEYASRTGFDRIVNAYMVTLISLAALNLLFAWLRWLPSVLDRTCMWW